MVEAFPWELLILSYTYTFFFVLLTQSWTRKMACNYKTLKFSLWKPPRQVYGIAWAILYPLIAYAAFAVRLDGGPWTNANVAGLVLYAVLQPVLALYSPLAAKQWHWTTFIVILIAAALAVLSAYYFSFVSTVACVFMALLAGWLAVAAALQLDIACSNSDSMIQSIRSFSNGRSVSTKKVQKF